MASLTGGKAPEDMSRVLRTIFTLKQAGKIAEASALIAWLSGSENVAASAKKAAGIKGDIGSKEALDYLHGILEVTKAAGYQGLVIVIDEAETILRMRQDIRGKSLNGIRQICDASDRYKGLLWLFTGTPEFFDTKRGVAGLQPLHDRIKFLTHDGFANPRQSQLELKPFDAVRLKEVAVRLREIYPTLNYTQLVNKITPDFINQLIAKVTTGFGGDVGVIPRQFLRQLIDLFDLAADHPDFNPQLDQGFEIKEPNEQEQRLKEGRSLFEEEADDIQGYSTIEF